jgi:hypothetical protein
MRRSVSGVADNPFAALGLPARAGLADADVRAAWKRIAAATHPDRDDGGDAARFGAAAAAYDTLRTAYGRGEALADLGRAGGPPRAGRAARRPVLGPVLGLVRLPGRGPGRRLAVRAAAAACVSVAGVLAAGWTPGTVGLLAGALTWLAVTGRPVRGPGRWRWGGRGR